MGTKFCVGVLSASLVVGMLGGCSGSERSVEAFCGTVRSEKERITTQLREATAAADAQEDAFAAVLLGLGASVQAMGELRTYFRKLDKVAPDAIATEMEILAEEVDRQFDAVSNAASNPLGGLAASVLGGLAASGPMNRVHQFALDNCGEGI